MDTLRIMNSLFISCFSIILVSCQSTPAEWKLHKVKEVDGFNWPEAIKVSDSNPVAVYVANIETSNNGGWDADGKGFISKLSSDGDVIDLKWRNSNFGFQFDAPKGMTILNDNLYIADISRLLVCPLNKKSEIEVINIKGAQRLNDITTDGKELFVSDTLAGKAYRVDPVTGSFKTIPAPGWINGITWHKGHLYCVSIKIHEVYELDLAGNSQPVPFGLIDKLKGPDGIEVLSDGSFIVSDLKGNSICHVSADKKSIRKLAEIPCPADIAIDQESGILYAPSLKENKITIFKLKF